MGLWGGANLYVELWGGLLSMWGWGVLSMWGWGGILYVGGELLSMWGYGGGPTLSLYISPLSIDIPVLHERLENSDGRGSRPKLHPTPPPTFVSHTNKIQLPDTCLFIARYRLTSKSGIFCVNTG